MSRITVIKDIIEKVIDGNEMFMSGIFSQFLSNVPAAILLSGFTDNYKALLVGTNVGGLGTLIASMASLISYKIYCLSEGADRKKYFISFTVANVSGFIVLMIISKLYFKM